MENMQNAGADGTTVHIQIADSLQVKKHIIWVGGTIPYIVSRNKFIWLVNRYKWQIHISQQTLLPYFYGLFLTLLLPCAKVKGALLWQIYARLKAVSLHWNSVEYMDKTFIVRF